MLNQGPELLFRVGSRYKKGQAHASPWNEVLGRALQDAAEGDEANAHEEAREGEALQEDAEEEGEVALLHQCAEES